MLPIKSNYIFALKSKFFYLSPITFFFCLSKCNRQLPPFPTSHLSRKGKADQTLYIKTNENLTNFYSYQAQEKENMRNIKVRERDQLLYINTNEDSTNHYSHKSRQKVNMRTHNLHFPLLGSRVYLPYV